MSILHLENVLIYHKINLEIGIVEGCGAKRRRRRRLPRVRFRDSVWLFALGHTFVGADVLILVNYVAVEIACW